MEGGKGPILGIQLGPLLVGMATGRVRAGFFHTRARPAGLDPRPEPGPISNRIFFPEPRPAPPGPVGPRYFRAHSVAQKKKIFA